MKTKNGNLIKLAIQGHFDVIVHGCNCFSVMGAGIARQIKRAFPQAYLADQETSKGDKAKLGTISIAEYGNVDFNNSIKSQAVKFSKKITIVNAYTQHGYGSSGSQHLDYDALVQVFSLIKINYAGQKSLIQKLEQVWLVVTGIRFTT